MKTNQQFRFIFSFGFSDRLLVPLVAVTLTLLATNGAAAPAQQAYIKASNTGGVMPPDIPGDGFGTVAVDGETMVVGAPGEASSATGVNGDESDNSARFSGAAYVFVRSGTNWSQL